MKKMIALVLALVMIAACMTACGSKGGNDTDKVYELKVSTTQTEKSMIYAGLQAAADSVAEKTNGKVKITIYPSSQLGAEEDMIDQALQGMGIAVLTDAGRLSSYVKDIGILNMAYIVENYDQGLKLMETEGVTVLTCGTCLDFYGLKEKLAVGGVTNMYDIVERMENAAQIIKP